MWNFRWVIYPPNILSVAVASGVHVWGWAEPKRIEGSGAGFLHTGDMNALHFRSSCRRMQWNFRYANWIGDALVMRRLELDWVDGLVLGRLHVGACIQVVAFWSEKQSWIFNWLNMARMLTVDIQNFLSNFFEKTFRIFHSFVKFGDVFSEAILKDFGKFDLIVGSDIILSSFDARMCSFIVHQMFISGYIPKGSAVQTTDQITLVLFCQKPARLAQDVVFCGEWFETFFWDWFQILSLDKSCKKLVGPWIKLPRIWTNSSAVVALY